MKKMVVVLTGVLLMTCAVQAELIGTVDYSDTFTLNGTTRTDFFENGYQFMDDAAKQIEDAHGNAVVSWADELKGGDPWLLCKDSTASSHGQWRGSNGKGSDTGLTAVCGNQGYRGISYTTDGTASGSSLRDTYVVSLDATLTDDWVALSSKANPGDDIFQAGALSVLFRGQANSRQITIYNPSVDSAADYIVANVPTGVDAWEWHNLAVEFAPTTLKIYVDESLLTTVDLTNVGGKNFTGYSQKAVGFGFCTTGDPVVEWMDNFAVGAPIPEPATIGLLMIGGFLLRRKS